MTDRTGRRSRRPLSDFRKWRPASTPDRVPRAWATARSSRTVAARRLSRSRVVRHVGPDGAVQSGARPRRPPARPGGRARLPAAGRRSAPSASARYEMCNELLRALSARTSADVYEHPRRDAEAPVALRTRNAAAKVEGRATRPPRLARSPPPTPTAPSGAPRRPRLTDGTGTMSVRPPPTPPTPPPGGCGPTATRSPQPLRSSASATPTSTPRSRLAPSMRPLPPSPSTRPGTACGWWRCCQIRSCPPRAASRSRPTRRQVIRSASRQAPESACGAD